MIATGGAFVAFHYRMMDSEGFEFDVTVTPMCTILGAGRVVPGLERALLGRASGERFHIDLSPLDAFGERDEAEMRTMPREAFPPETVLMRGTELRACCDEGPELPFWVVEAGEDGVVVDFNHPLAGMAVSFDVTVVEVRRPTVAELTELR